MKLGTPDGGAVVACELRCVAHTMQVHIEDPWTLVKEVIVNCGYPQTVVLGRREQRVYFFLQKHGITHQHRSFTIQGSFKKNPAAETKRNGDWLSFNRDFQVVARQRCCVNPLVFNVGTLFPTQ